MCCENVLRYNPAQHPPTSGCTNISTMIEIIDWPRPGQIRTYLSYNRIMSTEMSLLLSHSIIYLNWHQPQTMSRHSTHILGEFHIQTKNVYQNASRNETNWIIQSWGFNSSATVVPAAVALPFCIKGCRVVSICFGIVLISGPGRAQNYR